MGRKMNEKDAILIARYNEFLASSVDRSCLELGEKFKSISREEIKSKDRVDITLEEYENMKREINSLKSEVKYLGSILEKIEAPLDKTIIPDSIRTYYCDDYMNYRRAFRIEFAIDEREFRA